MPNKYKDAQISLRDYFAGLAMQAIISNPSLDILAPSDVSSDAYNQADAMLAEREKSTPVVKSTTLFSDAPEWAVCVATDESGVSYYYEAVPTMGSFAWTTRKGTRKQEASSDFNGYWKNSLIMRGAE